MARSYDKVVINTVNVTCSKNELAQISFWKNEAVNHSLGYKINIKSPSRLHYNH